MIVFVFVLSLQIEISPLSHSILLKFLQELLTFFVFCHF
jgi:hypothetical protein